MGGGDDLPGRSAVVVTEVVGDERAGADEVVVLVEEETGPGELSRSRSTVTQVPEEGLLPGAALLGAASHVLRAALGPGHVLDSRVRGDAGHTEHGQVNAGVVAAGFLPCGAGRLLCIGVGSGSVDDPGGDAAGPVLQPGVNQTGAHQVVSSKQVAALFLEGDAAALLGSSPCWLVALTVSEGLTNTGAAGAAGAG